MGLGQELGRYMVMEQIKNTSWLELGLPWLKSLLLLRALKILCVCACSGASVVCDSANCKETLWTAALQVPLSM